MEKEIEKKPNLCPTWASAGDIFQPTPDEIAQGWPKSDTPPSRQRFNWILNYVCALGHYLIQRGIPEWDESQIYPKGAKVSGPDGLTYAARQQTREGEDPRVSESWVRWGYTQDELVNAVQALDPGGTPTGTVIFFSGKQAPSGWLAAAGQTLNRSEYGRLWAHAQKSDNLVSDDAWREKMLFGAFSEGDGKTTFRLPDLRGVFLRAFDDQINGRGNIGTGKKRAFASLQKQSVQRTPLINPHLGTPTWYTAKILDSALAYGGEKSAEVVTMNATSIKAEDKKLYSLSVDDLGLETRPVNITLLACIKA